MENPAGQRYRAPVLDKELGIIELLALQHRGLTQAEIVNAPGSGWTTCSAGRENSVLQLRGAVQFNLSFW